MLINFTKMHGLGNDFMVINNIDGSISLSVKQIIKLSNRNLGVGFDQLLMVEKPDNKKENDFKYRIFNADGSEVEQCGNGARCFARFVIKRQLTDKRVGDPISVETKGGVIKLMVVDDDKVLTIRGERIWPPEYTIVMVTMEKPVWCPQNIPFKQLENDNATYIVEDEKVGVVSMGNPHAVLIADDIDQEIETIAKKIQSSADFPEGVNVNFVKIVDSSRIRLRVYERGVGETLACGSGACATVAYLDKTGRVNNQENTVVELKGGRLVVGFNQDTRGTNHEEIIMLGSAEFVFEGQVEV